MNKTSKYGLRTSTPTTPELNRPSPAWRARSPPKTELNSRKLELVTLADATKTFTGETVWRIPVNSEVFARAVAVFINVRGNTTVYQLGWGNGALVKLSGANTSAALFTGLLSGAFLTFLPLDINGAPTAHLPVPEKVTELVLSSTSSLKGEYTFKATAIVVGTD